MMTKKSIGAMAALLGLVSVYAWIRAIDQCFSRRHSYRPFEGFDSRRHDHCDAILAPECRVPLSRTNPAHTSFLRCNQARTRSVPNSQDFRLRRLRTFSSVARNK